MNCLICLGESLKVVSRIFSFLNLYKVSNFHLFLDNPAVLQEFREPAHIRSISLLINRKSVNVIATVWNKTINAELFCRYILTFSGLAKHSGINYKLNLNYLRHHRLLHNYIHNKKSCYFVFTRVS
jgi:hypothetical protein